MGGPRADGQPEPIFAPGQAEAAARDGGSDLVCFANFVLGDTVAAHQVILTNCTLAKHDESLIARESAGRQEGERVSGLCAGQFRLDAQAHEVRIRLLRRHSGTRG